MLRRPSPPKRRTFPTQFLIYTLKIRNRRKPKRISHLHFSNLYKSPAFFIMLWFPVSSAPLRRARQLASSSVAVFLIAKWGIRNSSNSRLFRTLHFSNRPKTPNRHPAFPAPQLPVRPLALPARRLVEVEPSSTRVLASAFSASCAVGPIVQAAAVRESAGSSRRRRGALRIRSARILRALRRDAHANARHEFAGWPRSPRFPRRISARSVLSFPPRLSVFSRLFLRPLRARCVSAMDYPATLLEGARRASHFRFSVFHFPILECEP